MLLMVACGVLVAFALAIAFRWRALAVVLPPAPALLEPERSGGRAFERVVWHATVAAAAGLGAGVLVAGAGGRLAMRLLAATAGDGAQGRVTEAEEVVGRITAGGTFSFVVFTALFFGIPTGVLYVLLRRGLPLAVPGGLAFGAVLLVVAGPHVDPLRRANPDFDIVGPGWLAVAVFLALGLLHGATVAAIAGRYSRLLRPLSDGRRAVPGYLPLVPLLTFPPALVVLVVVGGATAIVTSRLGPAAPEDGRRARRVAQAAVGLAVLAGLPAFVGAAVDIAGRGPGL